MLKKRRSNNSGTRTKKQERQYVVLSKDINKILKSGQQCTDGKKAEIMQFFKKLPNNKYFVVTLSIPDDKDVLIEGTCQFVENPDITTNENSQKKHTILFCFEKNGKGKIEPFGTVKSKIIKNSIYSSNFEICRKLLAIINEHSSRHAAQKEYSVAA